MAKNVRFIRLIAEYQKICVLAELSEFVRIVKTEGNPPEKYILELTCKGISKLNGELPIYSESHLLEIFLGSEFPKDEPIFRLNTPIWHPNIFNDGRISLFDADYDDGYLYSPSIKLDDLVIEIIKIIRYEKMWVNSCANLLAGVWA